jgi:hypothetical protein
MAIRLDRIVVRHDRTIRFLGVHCDGADAYCGSNGMNCDRDGNAPRCGGAAQQRDGAGLTWSADAALAANRRSKQPRNSLATRDLVA